VGTGTDSGKITLVKGDLQGIVKAKNESCLLIKIYFLLSFIVLIPVQGFYIRSLLSLLHEL
jgi:hypothetical protein